MASNYAYWQKKNAVEDYAVWQAELKRQEQIKKNAVDFFNKCKLSHEYSFCFDLIAISEKFVLLQAEETSENPFYIASFTGFKLQEIKRIGGNFEKAIKVFYLQNCVKSGEVLP